MKTSHDLIAIAPAACLILSSGTAIGHEDHWLLEDAGVESCLAGKLEAFAASGIDEDSGADGRHYPPDRHVDYLHMKLELRFDDLEVPEFTAVETLRVRPIARPTQTLSLDAVGLDVSRVRIGSRPVEFFADDETLTLRFDPPLDLETEHEIVFDYVCRTPSDGLYFTPSASDRGYTAEVHTQGQTITNRHWFIAHDAPNERLSTELIVDVPAGYQVSSNGRLVSSFDNGTRAVWHWLQQKPHVSYLVSLVIGTFDVVELPHPRVAMSVWVPRGMGDRVDGCYGRTGRMIDLFERRFGVPYPWDRYDQLVVKNFGAGGMENTSATTMYPTAILDEVALRDGDLDGLIAHELAHQWSGDLLTCKEWAHIWLNEGFATFGSALWSEERHGEDGYLLAMRRSFGVARRDRTDGAVGMVSPIYDHPRETFRGAANPYPKGSSILHMLRRSLGEEVFWKGIHLYMNRHALGVVETNDLRYAMEEVSGLGLEWFFEQWCERPGAPALDIKIDYDGSQRALAVEVEQTQQIDERTPAFRFTLPLTVVTEDGTAEFTMDVRGRTTTGRFVLDGAPRIVAVDPQLHVLSTMQIEKPAQLWRNQLDDGPTIVARLRAIEAIGERETDESRDVLADLVADETLHHGLRRAAVAALRGFGSSLAHERLVALADSDIEDPKVRVRVVEALRDAEAAQAVSILARFAGSDPSYDTRAAAIAGLATHEATEHTDLIIEMTRFESQHDRVRQAALSALADLDDERGIDLALEYASYGHTDRSRPTAMSALGKLAHHDPDRIVPALIGWLDDPCRRPADAAAQALAETGDERARAPLEAIRDHDPRARRRSRAERWITRLDRAADDPE